MANLISQITPYGKTSDYGFRASAVQYGTCATGASTAAKAVTCASFTSNYLVEGSIVAVKFSNTNTAAVSGLTLNVNSTGAKSIKYIHNGDLVDIPQAGFLKQNQVYLFYYDGTNWVVLLDFNTNTQYAISSTNPTLAWSTTSTILTVDGTDYKVTMPSNPNTDEKVTQTISSTSNADYRVLFSYSANDTTTTEGARKDTDFKYNPSTNNLTVSKINGTSVSSFLTSHQTVTNSNPTLAWGTTSTVGSIGGTDITVTMPAQPTAADIGASIITIRRWS